MQVAPPIDAFEHVAEELGDVLHVQPRVVLAGGDPKILGQRQLAVAQQRIGQREQFARPLAFLIGHIAFAADGQQQRMHTRGVDGMNRSNARYLFRNHRADQVVN